MPPARRPRPENGWLAQNSGSVTFEDQAVVRQYLDASPDLDAFVAKVRAALPPDFTLVDSYVALDSACPDRTPDLEVEFSGPDGGIVHVGRDRLLSPWDWYTTPVSGEVNRSALPDGTEVATNDFGGEGVIRRVWVARPDGIVVRVRAAGSNAPDQSGWPTTRAPSTGPTSDPGPAPLGLGEMQALALDLLG